MIAQLYKQSYLSKYGFLQKNKKILAHYNKFFFDYQQFILKFNLNQGYLILVKNILYQQKQFLDLIKSPPKLLYIAILFIQTTQQSTLNDGQNLCKSYSQSQVQETGQLSVFQTSLAIISTIIGGGIVSLPYAFASAGVQVGIMVHIFSVSLMFCSIWFCLKAKDFLGYESFSEIAYICLGRSSVFVINILIAFCITGVITLYMILFSNISISIFGDMIEDTSSFWFAMLNSKIFYISFLFLFMLPHILKRKIDELKFNSYLLFIGVLLLISTFSYKAFLNEFGNKNQESTDEPTTKFVKLEEFDFGKLMDAFNIVIASYGFVINFFPIYSTMKGRSNKKGFFAVLIALAFCFLTYISFSLMAYDIYGKDINPNIFENIKQDNDLISVSLRLIFLLIFLCNIPFVFFPGKECLLTFIMEIKERRVSSKLEKQINMDLQIYHKLIDDEDKMVSTGRNSDIFYQINNFEEVKTTQNIEEITSHLTPRKDQSKDTEISNKIYYSVVILMFVTQCILASVITDLTLIFGIISAFAESTVSFVFPGLFFILGARFAKVKVPLYQLLLAGVFSLFGILYFFTSNYFNLMKVL